MHRFPDILATSLSFTWDELPTRLLFWEWWSLARSNFFVNCKSSSSLIAFCVCKTKKHRFPQSFSTTKKIMHFISLTLNWSGSFTCIPAFQPCEFIFSWKRLKAAPLNSQTANWFPIWNSHSVSHTHTHTGIQTHTHTHTHTRVHKHTHKHTDTHTYIFGGL